MGLGECIEIGQGEGFQDRPVGRQHGADAEGFGALPGEGAVHMVAQLPLPGVHAEKIQLDMGMFVVMASHQPGAGMAHPDAQFFLQLADQGLVGGFPGFHLAAGEFPVTGIESAGGALAEEEFPVAATLSLDDRRRHPGQLRDCAHAWPRPA